MSENVRVLSDLPDEGHVFRRSLPFLRGHWAGLTGVVVLNLVGTALAVGVTAVIGRVIDAAGDGRRDDLVSWAVTLLAMVVAGGVLTWQSRYRIVRVGEHALAGLRERATASVASAPMRFLEEHRRGELLRRLTGEINGLGQFVGGTLPDLVTTATVLVFTVIMLAAHSLVLTGLLLVLFVPPAVLVVRGFKHRAGPAYGEVAEAEAGVASAFSESVPAHEQLRITGAVPRWLERFGRANDRLLAAEEVRVRTELRLNRLALVQACGVGALLVAGAALVGSGSLSVGVAVVFVLATRDIFSRFDDLAGLVGDAREAQVRLARVLDLVEASGGEPAGDAPLPERGALAVDGVGFGYDAGRPVVEGLSFRVAAGDHLVIAGATGSGKSTVGKLLAGVYRPGAGSVAFGGVDLRDADPAQVRARIMTVPQEVLLVDGTLADNLAMVPGEPGRERIAEVLERLGLAEWADALPDGLDTRVGRNGARLSAGERQLVAVARAALAEPAVLILDEATADVDHATAARLETALAVAAGDRTLVMIAHRAATIARARRTLAMPEGRISAE
ncbi:ABC transporter ATP-binding protein [Actinomadura hibisca]|uniref:ABC transporter ATP-binding protein n=1 Tax=Actinomadura hibisca TaxID=68565 RepID=UPI0008356C40|nr:ABC transporter ATP-binding protein [Actinomadura hibisca]